MQPVILEGNNLTMDFNGFKALKKAQIKIYKGEVMALVGENGAGKSTLIKCLSGIYKPMQGRIRMFGQSITFASARAAIKSGIGVVHQELKLCDNLSIAENIFLGRWPIKGRIVNYKQMHTKSRKYLKTLGVHLNSYVKVGALSIAKQQLVEIARVLALGAKVIILDEPTDTLSKHDAKQLFNVLRKLKQQGIGILYITHRMQEIKEVCDRYTILKDGHFVQSGIVKNISIKAIIENMIGRKIKQQFPNHNAQRGASIMEIKNLSNRFIHNVNLKIHKGEILGIAGLVGAKRTEFAQTIVGLLPYFHGHVRYKKAFLKNISIKQAIQKGIYYVTENRKQDGLFLNLDVGHNIIISNLKCILNKLKMVSTFRIEKQVQALQRQLSIKFVSSKELVRSLSGGNQQKILLAKALLTSPELLILDEPTRGVDVGARKDIYTIINRLVERGKAIVVISSDLLEIIGISNRVAVFSKGRLSGLLAREQLSEQAIMNLAIK